MSSRDPTLASIPREASWQSSGLACHALKTASKAAVVSVILTSEQLSLVEGQMAMVKIGGES